MPNPYLDSLLTSLLNLTPAAVNAATINALSTGNTRGEQIIRDYNRRLALLPDPPAFDIETLMNSLHDRLIRDNWSWTPGGGGLRGAGRQLLDGNKNSGQCEVVAGALYALMICPPPFGCGQPAFGNPIRTYNNNELGFISNHPLNGIFNLPPNLYDVNGNLQRHLVNGNHVGRYVWDDHKVVFYNERFYDPNYNTSYDDLANMSAQNLTVAKQEQGNGDITFSTAAGLYVERSAIDYYGAGQDQFRLLRLASGPWNAPYNAGNPYPSPQGRPRPQPANLCYITTATCLSLGKSIDCEELRLLRWYRDNVLIKTSDGKKAAIEYYKSVEAVIHAINSKPKEEAKKIYQYIYQEYIAPAVTSVKGKDYPEVRSIFARALADMKKRFMGDIPSSMAVQFAASDATTPLSAKPVLINGMKVVFDKGVPTTPVTLKPKSDHRRKPSNDNGYRPY